VETLGRIAAAVATETKENASTVAAAFGLWASEGKKQFDAQAGEIIKSLDAQLTLKLKGETARSCSVCMSGPTHVASILHKLGLRDRVQAGMRRD
jgi:hypothetical protein